MPIELKFVLSVFMVYRLAELVSIDFGPANIFLRFRSWCRQKHRFLFDLAACPYCMGMWIALPLTIILFYSGWFTLLWWLGIAGAQSVLQNAIGRENAHD